ncbi:DUF6272 family protein [Crocinitomix catalasitica]|uniref:DUF6272 family protein n=1 Tax=Crocinitomix catalasitica TaxID=184607 RepID=UPI00048612F6|nr:DUF6272 family protein [Crocinitomix catalasitica]
MVAKKMYELYQDFLHEDFTFAYLDHFSDSATDALISLQDSRIAAKKLIRKRISYLITESFQNVIRHSESENSNFNKLFTVRSFGNRHSIVTINPIKKSARKNIENSIDGLEGLTESALRELYLEALQNNELDTKGGAGLGLIEMARKTKRAPKYKFTEISDSEYAFQLELTFYDDSNKKEVDLSKIMSTEEFYNYLKDNRVLLLQKGDFSKEAVMSLVEMLENNLIETNSIKNKSKKLYLIIELLQNMSHNTPVSINGKIGVFQISINELDQTVFKTGNYIKHENAVKFKNYLDEVQKLNGEQLLVRYKEELSKNITNDDQSSNAEVGILEILKLTEGNFTYEIVHIADDNCFVSLSATIVS